MEDPGSKETCKLEGSIVMVVMVVVVVEEKEEFEMSAIAAERRWRGQTSRDRSTMLSVHSSTPLLSPSSRAHRRTR